MTDFSDHYSIFLFLVDANAFRKENLKKCKDFMRKINQTLITAYVFPYNLHKSNLSKNIYLNQ